jgi:hypothetical protein
MKGTNMQKLTKEQAAIIGLYTGISCGGFGDIHELAEKLMGHPIWTHQFADKEFVNTLKEKVKPLFLEICSE